MNTKEVFLITSGDYSSYRVHTAFSTRELAEAFVKANRTKSEGFRIEPCPLDDFRDEVESGMENFTVEIPLKDGKLGMAVVLERKEGYPPDEQYPLGLNKEFIKLYSESEFKGYFYQVGTWARDEAHAVKIASEKAVQALAAEKEGK